MRALKNSYRSYLVLGAIIFICMSFSKTFTQTLRGFVVELMGSSWEAVAEGKSWASSIWNAEKNSFEVLDNKLTVPEEIARLHLENEQLREELRRLGDLHEQEGFIEMKLNELQELFSDTEQLKEPMKRHYQELRALLELQVQSLPARVIFRDPAFWGSSIWINVGQEDNALLSRHVVAKNSPVLSGTSVVGVVDYVGKRQSRVRLITDPGLNPSVRSVRGSKQNIVLNEHLEALIEAVTMRDDLFVSNEFNQSILYSLNVLRSRLFENHEEWHLAKGVLRGGVRPSYRSYGSYLRGVGFNYDFPDERGFARDLRSGEPLENSAQSSSMPILKVNDLLVTTGMDGVFPEGLPVAEVSKIDLLKEGGYAYDLEAKATAGNLEDLTMVFVIPPVNYDHADVPN